MSRLKAGRSLPGLTCSAAAGDGVGLLAACVLSSARRRGVAERHRESTRDGGSTAARLRSCGRNSRAVVEVTELRIMMGLVFERVALLFCEAQREERILG